MPEEAKSPVGEIARRIEAIRDGEPYETIDVEQARKLASLTMAGMNEALSVLGKRVTEEEPGEALARAHTILTGGEPFEADNEFFTSAIEAAAEEQGLDITKRRVRSDLARVLGENWYEIKDRYADSSRRILLPPMMEKLLSEGRTEAKAAAELIELHESRLDKKEAQDWMTRIVSALSDKEIEQLSLGSANRHRVIAALVETDRAGFAIQFAEDVHELSGTFERLKEKGHYRLAIRAVEGIDVRQAGFDTPVRYREVADRAIGELVAQGYSVSVEYSRFGDRLFRVSAKPVRKGTTRPTEVDYSSGALRVLRKQPGRSRQLAIAAVNERQEHLGPSGGGSGGAA